MDFYNIKVLYIYIFPCIKNSYNVHISTFPMVFVQTNLKINSVSLWYLLLDFFSGVSSRKVEAWMNTWFAFFLSLSLWLIFFTSLWGNHKDTWKKTKESALSFYSLLYLHMKKWQIFTNSFITSVESNWLQQKFGHTTATQSPSSCSVLGVIQPWGGTEK